MFPGNARRNRTGGAEYESPPAPGDLQPCAHISGDLFGRPPEKHIDRIDIPFDKAAPPDHLQGFSQLDITERRGIQAFDPVSPAGDHQFESVPACPARVQVCPHAVFLLADRKAVITDRDRCMECGACALNCPRGAISVRAGVGCAAALIQGKLRGTEPSCGCSEGKKACCG